MKLPELKIGSFIAKIPIIQGGMSIRVSTSALAIPVAECGGIGTIGGSGIPVPELQEDIRKAKKATKGVIAVNIMYAMKDFYELVMGSIEAGADMIITGAGFSRDVFKIGKTAQYPHRVDRFFTGLGHDGGKAGRCCCYCRGGRGWGTPGNRDIVARPFPPIRKVVSKIPLIAAGGITDGFEMAEMMDKYGADGVQIASRFVLSKECSVSQAFKETYLNAREEDIVLVSSPVGMPGRAVKTPFVEKMLKGEDISADKCMYKCLKKCNYKYCISERLTAAFKGDVTNGLVFSGANTFKMKEILSVQEIFDNFVKAAESVYKEKLAPC